MAEEQRYALIGLCLLAGYAFGSFLSAEIVARCMAGVSVRKIGTGQPSIENISGCLGKPAGLAVAAGDAIKTVMVCWFCYRLAAPELGHAAVLYGGIGVVSGHSWPLWYGGRGGGAAIVASIWLVLCFPITGVLCLLAGMVAMAGTQRKGLESVLAVALAVPVAFLQFEWQSGFATFLVELLLVWQYRKKMAGMRKGKGGSSVDS